MALSSSSLFHFTRRGLSALKGILRDGFRVSYCCEVSINAYRDHRHDEYGGPYLVRPSPEIPDSKPFSSTIMVPMICFCDIPLSNVKYHVEKYGKYAIGVEKEWGIQNGLNPVFYIARNSSVAKAMQAVNSKKTERKISKTIYVQFPEEKAIDLYDYDSDSDEIIDNQGNVYTLPSLYLKPLGEFVYKREKDGTELEYYQDEKEWRYIPPKPYLTILNERHRITQQQQQNAHNDNFAKSYHKHIAKYPNVPFCIEDTTSQDEEAKIPRFKPYENLNINMSNITFILVEKEAEIPEIIEFILGEFGNYEDVNFLLSKVISYERMEKDIFV